MIFFEGLVESLFVKDLLQRFKGPNFKKGVIFGSWLSQVNINREKKHHLQVISMSPWRLKPPATRATTEVPHPATEVTEAMLGGTGTGPCRNRRLLSSISLVFGRKHKKRTPRCLQGFC